MDLKSKFKLQTNKSTIDTYNTEVEDNQIEDEVFMVNFFNKKLLSYLNL